MSRILHLALGVVMRDRDQNSSRHRSIIHLVARRDERDSTYAYEKLASRPKPTKDANGRFTSPATHGNPSSESSETVDFITHRTLSPNAHSETTPTTPSSLSSGHSSDGELPLFEKPPSPIPHALIPTAPTITKAILPDYDSDTMLMDAWDGDTDKLSAQDFSRAFHRDVKVTTSSADKAKAFKHYLVAGSDVDIWYRALPAATRADMDLIDAALELQYPSEATVQPTAAEYGTELLKCRLTMEELSTKTKVADRDVRVELPKPLCTKIGKTHADWPAFIKAIRDVDTVDLELDMKEWKEEKEQRDKIAKMLEQRPAPASPTAGIRGQLANARIGAPAQGPARWPPLAPGANPFQAAQGGRQGNLFTAPRTPYQAQAPRTPYQPQVRQPAEVQQPLVGEQRCVLLEAIARITHHPDTDAGRCAHSDQQQAWFAAHGNVAMSVNTPYPLHLGCAPVNSGECFRCGYQGHTNYQRRCEAPPEQCLGVREQQWRRIALLALKEAPTAVRAVGFASWDTDDYGRPFGADKSHLEEADDQGNA
ncbi:hypothetical protein K438DRAFT_1992245 [Mycena galopus ATCC 62051]|nr:hypothetical protein K438DRAFT_1992245 [Mycena galopus ATCC 62051]